mgnify:FL=1
MKFRIKIDQGTGNEIIIPLMDLNRVYKVKKVEVNDYLLFEADRWFTPERAYIFKKLSDKLKIRQSFFSSVLIVIGVDGNKIRTKKMFSVEGEYREYLRNNFTDILVLIKDLKQEYSSVIELYNDVDRKGLK